MQILNLFVAILLWVYSNYRLIYKNKHGMARADDNTESNRTQQQWWSCIQLQKAMSPMMSLINCFTWQSGWQSLKGYVAWFLNSASSPRGKRKWEATVLPVSELEAAKIAIIWCVKKTNFKEDVKHASQSAWSWL